MEKRQGSRPDVTNKAIVLAGAVGAAGFGVEVAAVQPPAEDMAAAPSAHFVDSPVVDMLAADSFATETPEVGSLAADTLDRELEAG